MPVSARIAPSDDRPPALDLGTRWRDVLRLARCSPLWRLALYHGWEEADLEAEVLVRVLARQRLASAYDPTRSALGTYLTLLTRSLLHHLVAEATARREQPAALDASSVATTEAEAPWSHPRRLSPSPRPVSPRVLRRAGGSPVA